MKQSSILIVEDEAVVALDLQLQLEEMGYRVVGIAESGEQALRLAHAHRPDLALMDVMLQGPMNGIEVAERFNRELHLPVLFLTSLNDDTTVAGAAATSAYGYLTKPFQIREVRAGIEVALMKAHMEAELRESERWFASTLRCVQDGIILTERDARVRFLNPAAEALTGWRHDEAIGRPLQEVVRFVDGHDGPAAAAALAEGRVVQSWAGRRLQVHGDGEVPVDESAAPVRDDSDAPLGAVQVLRDARERLAHEDKLRASEERFRGAFDYAPLGMALVSLDGAFLLVNDALCRLLGVTPGMLRGHAERDFTHPDDVEVDRVPLRRLRDGGASLVHFEKRYRRHDGEPVWALVSASPLHESGRLVCLLYQMHDLTDHKQAEARLAELAAERVKLEAAALAERAKNDFLSRVSHEMRTPLNAVIGFAQLLDGQATTADPARVAAYSRYILNAGKHLLALVDDVLDIQRIVQGRLELKMEPVDVAESIAAAVTLAAPVGAPASVSVAQQAPTGLAVLADRMRLRQVLVNLVSNAIKFNRPGGAVSCSALALPGGRVRIVVEDHGEGISADDQRKLFQPFERLGRGSATPGSGLGLYISRRLVQDMGGSLVLDSTPGVGTRVTVELPQP